MKVFLTGGTGLIGRALTASILADGHTIWALTRRDPATVPVPTGVTLLRWDGRTPAGWGEYLSEMDAVINLAGEPLARWPWTKAQKECFWESRVRAGRALTEAILAASPRPKVLLQASGINHYGLRGDLADESTPPGDDFLARLTLAWEESTRPVEDAGVRRCVLRLAVVLAPQGGLFSLMALPVRLFAGGRLGNGKQAVPWVHIDDVIGAIRFLLQNEQSAGPYNVIAPQVVSNAEFYRRLAAALHRPYWLPVPAFVLKMILGEMSVLVLEGRPAWPRRLQEAGYQFQVETVAEAFKRLLK